MFEYETGMDTRVGFPNEHLAKGARPELESPMYATAIGLVMKGVEFNEKNPQMPIPAEVGEMPSPMNQPIEGVEGKTAPSSESEPIYETDVNPKESFFDKWVRGFMNFLANED